MCITGSCFLSLILIFSLPVQPFLFYEPAIEIKKYVYSHFYTKELMFFKLFNDIFHLHWLKNKVDMFTRFGV